MDPEPPTPLPVPDAEAEALRAVEAFESVGVTSCLALLVDDRTMRTDAWSIDSLTLRRNLRSYLEHNASRNESFIVRFYGPELIQVDDCDDAVRARLAPFAFLTYTTSPDRYQAWLCLSDASDHRSIRKRLFSRLAPTGANGTPEGATRWPGTLNCKPKHRRPDGSFPRLTIVSSAPGRRVAARALEQAGLLAPRAAARLRPWLRTVLPRLSDVARLTRAAAFWNRKQVLFLQYRGVTDHPEYPLRLEKRGHLRAAHFTAQLDYLRQHRRVIPLRACLKALREGHDLPDYSAVLTFDEGYRNFLSAAAPLLLARGLPATLCVVPERLSRENPAGGAPWTPCDDETYLSWEEIETLRRQGFEIGVNLPHRSTYVADSVDAAAGTLSRCYHELVARTNDPSPALALRQGEYAPSLVEHARRLGFSCTLRVADQGMNAGATDPFALRRLIFDRQSHEDLRMFAADVSGLRLWWTRLAGHPVDEG